MTTVFAKVAAVWDWLVVNVNALGEEEETPRSVFATSPMWWGELLEPPPAE